MGKVRFSVSDSSTYLTTNLFLENDDAEHNKEKMIVVDNISELLRKNNQKRRFERRLSRTPNKLLNDAHEILRQQYEENSIHNNNNDDDENNISNRINGQ